MRVSFATYTIDHQGHGFSNGLVVDILNINPIINDYITFFHNFCRHFDPSLHSFLYSKSLDGVSSWNGLILIGASADQCQVQAALTTKAGDGESTVDGGAFAHNDKIGVIVDLPQATKEARGGGGAVLGGARR
ncbi:hypothetical protein Fmac_018644 [Flemingia macrophylla]|uniref:Uncharacterized protein n=1 Tax=Flemingia macrophylla TaxID=520843 RepID=A0ABD1M5M8_9FABA